MELTISPNYTSVDCVVFGFDGERLNVLLLRRTGVEEGEVYHDMKLPGSLIYQDEDLDEAATRVLTELTGLKKAGLVQFRAYGSRNRTRDPKDVHWLEKVQQTRVDRIVTVAYLGFLRISNLKPNVTNLEATWVPVEQVPTLAFDHNIIVRDAEAYLHAYIAREPSGLFRLLPRQFTVTQLRKVYNTVTGEQIDARNFYKKLKVMPYVVPLKLQETHVAHRAARYYAFDAKIYKKYRI